MTGEDPDSTGESGSEDAETGSEASDIAEALLAGEYRALARAISMIEDRRPGYREVVAELHAHAGSAEIIGVTGSPGTGKSTLVDRMAAAYRERDETVGVIAIDPASPFTGGAVLGDRVRMGSNADDMGVFVRSMSARGTLGGLSAATADAITALDAFGKDRIIVETVGAGQNEIDVVRTADTVCVLLQPKRGDDVQALKAGILEIADVLVVNKADQDGVDRLVSDLREMIDLGEEAGSHRITAGVGTPTRDDRHGERERTDERSGASWTPPIVETVATEGDGVGDLLSAVAGHGAFLDASGLRAEKARARQAEAIRTLLVDDLRELVEAEIESRGGLGDLVDAVASRETDPYAAVEDLLGPFEDCLKEGRRD
ncbi:MAG: methylmalonyl Co-A mutase-associated GTPase MeaB [Halobacteriales archaeon]